MIFDANWDNMAMACLYQLLFIIVIIYYYKIILMDNLILSV